MCAAPASTASAAARAPAGRRGAAADQGRGEGVDGAAIDPRDHHPAGAVIDADHVSGYGNRLLFPFFRDFVTDAPGAIAVPGVAGRSG